MITKFDVMDLPIYPSGLQAEASVTFDVRLMTTSSTVTINGDLYTYKTDFAGQTAMQVAKSLAAVINGSVIEGEEVVNLAKVKIIRSYAAIVRGEKLYLVATQPGADGNLLTLAAGGTGIAVSGATFSGGVDGGGLSSITLGQNRSSTNTSNGIETAADTVLAANASRKQWMIQNLGTNPLFVKLGTGASTSSFDVVLAPGSANDDGFGATYRDEVWQGAVSVAGTSPRYVGNERT